MKRLAFVVISALALVACTPKTADSQTDAAPAPAAPLLQAPPLERTTPTSKGQVQLSLAQAARKASPSVVAVFASRTTRRVVADPRFAPFGLFYGVPREQVERSLGSGVIVRADGIIITNNHVVEGAQELKVVLDDRRQFDAKLVLADPRVDLAVLRINPGTERLPAVVFADTSSAQVGDFVLAIGNPYGLQQTVTSGIISALARTDVGITDYSFFIQTDAAINHGNSGGALVNGNGELVGVNTAIFSESGGSVGLGFAIPAEMARRTVESAVTTGKVVRPWLGVGGQGVSADVARSLGLDRPRGVIVSRVYPGGPAAKAGLRNGDVILAVNGAEVSDENGLRFLAATQRPGAALRVDYLRDGKTASVVAKVEGLPDKPAADPRDISGRNPLDGTRLVTINPASADAAGLDPLTSGVLIQAMRDGAAAQLGLKPGDIVRSINNREVRTSAEAAAALSAGGPAWSIVIERDGKRAALNVAL